MPRVQKGERLPRVCHACMCDEHDECVDRECTCTHTP